MAEKEYLVRLGERARKRHYHKTEKGQVVTFMVQLEIEVKEGFGNLWFVMTARTILLIATATI